MLFSTGLASARGGEPFTIEVVDEADGRGVPLVLLETTDRIRFYTDSNGIVAFDEPGLMSQEVWFTISSHGYQFPKESFGQRGVTLKTEPGGAVRLGIRRLNIAQRLYRVTGQGIYRDTVMVGRQPPIEHPLLNGKVMGQDSCQTAVYQGQLYWFWGDTARPSHFLGNFAMSGATSQLPESGGLPPSVGVNLKYFVNPETGFSKPMADTGPPGPGPTSKGPASKGPASKGPASKGPAKKGPVWLDAILTVKDDAGRERMFAHYQRVDGFEPIERGLMVYNDAQEQFEAFAQIPLDARVAPGGIPFRAAVDGQDYFYFAVPYPAVRVKADWASICDLTAYEAFTCLEDGTDYSPETVAIDRDADGKSIWRWRKDTAVLEPTEIQELIARGELKREECPFRLQNVDDGSPLVLHRSSVYWNEYRQRWVMIGGELFGESMVGEVWFAEAIAPEGPWIDAKKVATHAMPENDQDFYNPLQHPYFAEDGGRVIYFEGTFVNTFSGNPFSVPRYNYNQLMYRLDLSDPRLQLSESDEPAVGPAPSSPVPSPPNGSRENIDTNP